VKTLQELIALRKIPEACASDDAFETWQDAVKKKYPNVASKLKFKNKDQGKHISAEVDGEDRSYGVWDVKACKGEVLSESVDDSDDIHDLLDKWMDANRVHSFEGYSAVPNLEKLVRALNPDYTSLEEFLADNSGACEAMINWIQESNMKEWVEALKSQLDNEE